MILQVVVKRSCNTTLTFIFFLTNFANIFFTVIFFAMKILPNWWLIIRHFNLILNCVKLNFLMKWYECSIIKLPKWNYLLAFLAYYHGVPKWNCLLLSVYLFLYHCIEYFPLYYSDSGNSYESNTDINIRRKIFKYLNILEYSFQRWLT